MPRIDFAGSGGAIRVETSARNSCAVIEIADNGSGIAPDLLPRIFDLFVQGDRTLDRSQGGLGIGLSVVKRLVEMHDGEVVARSEGPGRGSAFEIRLPLVLLDIGLPAMDGYEVARRMRAMPELRGVKLVAVTGYGQPDDRRRTRDAGFDDHLTKPVELSNVERTIAGLANTQNE